MMLYALGAIMQFNPFYDIQNVHMIIFQPRNGGAKTWSTTRNVLLDWGQLTVKPLAQTAAQGEGNFKKGDWCTFCRVKARCRLHAESLSAVAEFKQQLPPLLSNAEMGRALEAGRPFMDWFRKLESYALTAVLRGEEVPGWKAVEGRHSDRTFIDADKTFDAIKATGIEEALLYERKPITLTAVEKLLGKTEFAKLEPEHVYRPPGKPTLVTIDDPREPFGLSSAQADFCDQPIQTV